MLRINFGFQFVQELCSNKNQKIIVPKTGKINVITRLKLLGEATKH